MRLVSIALAWLLIGGTLYGLSRTEWFVEGADRILDRGRQAIYRKEVRFAGLESLAPGDLEALLPWSKSVPWWYGNTVELESRLMQHPLAAKAAARSCRPWAWGCFEFEVRERRPAVLTALDGETWVVGRDGGFIVPASNRRELQRLFGGRPEVLRRLPLVEGVMLRSSSPELAKGRLRHAIAAMALLSAETGLKVSRMHLRENGEVEVRFQGLPAVAVFDVIKGRSARLREEARRFRDVLEEFRGREDKLQSVDLAFNKIAVIKLAE